MDRFQNKYRIPSARLQTWNYANEGAYFITICTKDKVQYLGDIVEGEMNLSQVGLLADVFWHEIKSHEKRVELDAFVVMPNHIHGILFLKQASENVETRHDFPSPTNLEWSEKTIGQKRFQNQGKHTLSAIIGSYKAAVTKHANRMGLLFAWQSRFHDHIIRNEESYDRIRNYIINNPQNWNKDMFFV